MSCSVRRPCTPNHLSHAPSASAWKPMWSSMKLEMKKVRVIVPRLHAHLAAHLASGVIACGDKGVRLELIDVPREEVVRPALIHKELERWPAVALDELARIMRLARLDAAEIAGEGLDSPRAVGRVADGRERRDGGVGRGVLQANRQSAMPTHRVAKDGLLTGQDLGSERTLDQLRKLIGDVRVHVVVLCPDGFGRIHVKSGAAAKVVAVVCSLDGDTTWRGVRHDDGDTARGGCTREP
mmetsp:Transcript_43246/g.113602  ORF Transcript_43246/g.113602 Transcript_43246/m.113602 type:complete len:239 (+) Transcript_43246:209-925(+)